MVFGRRRELRMPTREEAPVGRGELAYTVPERHAVLGTALHGPYPEGHRVAELIVSLVVVLGINGWECAGVCPGRTSTGEFRSLN
ncbi:hypothetical protein PV682_34800, partial [Streptomyces niveiscabiei]|nr:hypothetical protein [Streptomyces niveiscabiei]